MPRYAQSFIWGLRTDNFYIRKFIQCKDFLIGLLAWEIWFHGKAIQPIFKNSSAMTWKLFKLTVSEISKELRSVY